MFGQVALNKLIAKLASNNITAPVVVLLYGNDRGAMDNIINNCANKLSYDVVRLDENADIGHVLSKMNNNNLFASNEIFTISPSNNNVLSEIIDNLNRFSASNILFILVNNISGNAIKKIKKIFFDSKDLVAISCYTESDNNLRDKLCNILPDLKSEILDYLTVHLAHCDYNIIQNEIEKIKLYIKCHNDIKLDDVRDMLSDNQKYSLDDLFIYHAKNDVLKFRNLCNQMQNDTSQEIITLIRVLLRNYSMLFCAKHLIDQCKALNQSDIDIVINKAIRDGLLQISYGLKQEYVVLCSNLSYKDIISKISKLRRIETNHKISGFSNLMQL